VCTDYKEGKLDASDKTLFDKAFAAEKSGVYLADKKAVAAAATVATAVSIEAHTPSPNVAMEIETSTAAKRGSFLSNLLVRAEKLRESLNDDRLSFYLFVGLFLCLLTLSGLLMASFSLWRRADQRASELQAQLQEIERLLGQLASEKSKSNR
jgi:hypothetical protein